MKRLIVLLVTAAALLAPSAALASGVVLKVEKASHLVAVRKSAKDVVLVHTTAAARLRVGERVSLTARKLRNGTLAASKVTVIGRARKVSFRGVLLAKSNTRYVVSAGGAVVAVARGSGGRSLASANDSGPAPGSTVDVTATVGSSGELEESQVTTFSPTAPGGQVEGHLAIGTGTISVSSEHMSLVLKVPTGFDLSKFANGDEVLATFSQGADGSLTLTELSANDSVQQADQPDDNGGENQDNQNNQSGTSSTSGTSGTSDSSGTSGSTGGGGDDGSDG